MSECPEEEVNDVARIIRKVMQEILYLSQVICGSRVCTWIKARALDKGSGGQQRILAKMQRYKLAHSSLETIQN